MLAADRTTLLVIGDPIGPFIDAVHRDNSTPFSITKLRGQKKEWSAATWQTTFHGSHSDRALYQLPGYYVRAENMVDLVKEASRKFPALRFFCHTDGGDIVLVTGGNHSVFIQRIEDVVGRYVNSITKKLLPLGVYVSRGTDSPLQWDTSYLPSLSAALRQSLQDAFDNDCDPVAPIIDWGPLLDRQRLLLMNGAVEISRAMQVLHQQLLNELEDSQRRNQ